MISKLVIASALLVSSGFAFQAPIFKKFNLAQLQWKQEVSNRFTWNVTQQMSWQVVNAFQDVQTSPDGEIYAIQKIEQELNDPKWFVYVYNTHESIFTLFSEEFQAKAVRFDYLGNKYFLRPDNCVVNEKYEKLVCGLSDFEVTVRGEIYGLHDGTDTLPADTLETPFHEDTVSGVKYLALEGYRGITLLREKPILINEDYTIDGFGTERFISVSAGIDGALWGLQFQEGLKDYPVLKWQTITKRWYKVAGAVGTTLSAYNEISVALVDSSGLLRLSSSAANSEAVAYPDDPTSRILNDEDYKYLLDIDGTQEYSFSSLELCLSVNKEVDVERVYDSCGSSDEPLFIVFKSTAGKKLGVYIQEGIQGLLFSEDIVPTGTIIFTLDPPDNFQSLEGTEYVDLNQVYDETEQSVVVQAGQYLAHINYLCTGENAIENGDNKDEDLTDFTGKNSFNKFKCAQLDMYHAVA